jgi:hypothetical protein
LQRTPLYIYRNGARGLALAVATVVVLAIKVYPSSLIEFARAAIAGF